MLGSFQHSRDNVQAGVTFNVANGKGITLFNDTAGAIAKGQIVLIGYDVDGNDGLLEGVQCIACATNSFVIYTAVAMEIVAVDAIGYFQVSGVCSYALVDGTADVVAGDFLEVINAGEAMIKAGASRTLGSCAIALGAMATDAGTATPVLLIGEPHTIESS